MKRHSTPGNAPRSEQRRKLVKSIVAGGGAVSAGLAGEKWIKPVVNAVIVPAHAQLSPTPPITGPAYLTLAIDTTSVASVMDYFISSAYAACVSGGGGCPVCDLNGDFCFNRPTAGSIEIFFRGQSSGVKSYTEGVQVSVTFNVLPTVAPTNPDASGTPDQTYDVILNFTIVGNTVSGTVSCSTVPYKSNNTINFNKDLVEGSCGSV